MEDKKIESIRNLVKPCIEHCEDLGISKTIINLFIHMQEQKYERNYKEATNSRI
ncbi:hypothetical protein AM1BK_32510 [Neobacillus kokaensis]|uniref:Uncharacterized protein n=1 Tax=Neobacillus kokaensis TaxID=2759023 RepID=A0ABQ3N861_9BACI|nr:hypothetical protein AM1BK_32510 [Neobacillus kokaensis]